ncbi:DNA adenine methylase [Candidatus Dojkabacteria bacterium]|jgi:DNA adenine methylase|nr:DNA adenine methylase [Candidatus Dojkabacteria bacterium]
MDKNFIGQKRKKLYTEFISKFIPQNIKTYIEPFGGSFAVSTYLDNKPDTLIYNDINHYDINIVADITHHLDYKVIFDMYDNADTVFFLDPPYFRKEKWYAGCENYTKDFHIELHDEIKKLKGKVILSYEKHKFILDLYKDFNVYEYDGTNYLFKKEMIITNFYI